jgi:hypothetical protein
MGHFSKCVGSVDRGNHLLHFDAATGTARSLFAFMKARYICGTQGGAHGSAKEETSCDGVLCVSDTAVVLPPLRLI